MNPTITQSEAIQRIMQEHDALRDKVRRIHSVLAEPEPAQGEIEFLLREFLIALFVHFDYEEDEGFFDQVASHAPRLAGKAGELCIEHEQMLLEADELCRFAASGSPSMPWWRELRLRCHEFSKRLMQHEHEENKLLQEARQSDIGVCD
jgi:iron-sulfur cluster repair protein YtfE (RIC family)